MTVKRKLLVLFGVWIAFCAVVGAFALREVDRLGRAIDVIMRENYRSVVLCQQVAESVERMNAALLSAFAGKAPPAGFFEKHAERIETLWEEERRNVTVPREGEQVKKASEDLVKFLRLQRELVGMKDDPERGLPRYAQEMLPLLGVLRSGVGGIQKLNQDRMHQADVAARTKVERMFRTGIGLLVFSLLIFCFLAWILTRWIQAPLQQVLDMCDEIGRGNFSLALKSRGKDEIGQLMRSFNDMASSLRSGRSDLEERIRQSEQSAQLRQQELEYRIVMGFSLRFKKLLDDILMSVYVLLEGKGGDLTDKQSELLANIREDALKISDAGVRMLRFRGRGTDADGCQPKVAVQQALERFRANANQSEIDLTADCAAGLPSVRLSPENLGLALNQLLDNALRFTPAGGTVRLSAVASGDGVEFAVADSGPGVPPERRTKVFEPFSTGGEKTNGHLGLGLSFVREGIVRAGGDVGVRDREGGGAVFWFTLPAVVERKEETC